MTYGVEAVIPLETGFPTLRTSLFNPSSNNELLEKSLDFIEEKRESAKVQLAYYQHKLKQGYCMAPNIQVHLGHGSIVWLWGPTSVPLGILA